MVERIKADLDEAIQQPDDELFTRIGSLAGALEKQPSVFWKEPLELTRTVEQVATSEADILGLGKKIANEISRQLRDLICGEGNDWEAERKQFEEGLKSGIDLLAKVISGIFAAAFAAIPAAIATWIAAVLAKALVRAGVKLACDIWPEPASA